VSRLAAPVNPGALPEDDAGPLDAGPPRLGAPNAGGGPPPSGLAPKPLGPPIAQQGPPQLPPAPQLQKPSLLRRIAAGAVGGLAGYQNATGRTAPIDVSAATNEIKYPGMAREQANYGMQAQRMAAQAKLDKEAADIQHTQAQGQEAVQRGRLYGQQADTLAEEGKRAPKSNYITFGGDGLFDASTGETVREPSNKKNAADFIEIAPDKAQALGLRPDKDGRYFIPKEGIGPYLTSTMKPEKPDSWQTKNETDAQGNVWEWRVNPHTNESTQPVSKGKLGKPQQVPAAIQLGGLLAGNQDAVTTAATQYRQTRQMPPIGRNPMMALAVLDKVAKMDMAEGISPEESGVKAEIFKANRAALLDITKRESQVATMEKTAGRNLDVFLQQAQKVADSGIVPANKVFRGAAKVFGDPGMAAFEAARVTAFTEISRVLSGSMSAVLSDSARKEAETILRGDYTLPQLMRVAQTLRTDMKNRMDSFAEQKKSLAQSMGGGNQQPQQGGSGGRGAGQQPKTDPLGIR
jgi:hypothetical protein